MTLIVRKGCVARGLVDFDAARASLLADDVGHCHYPYEDFVLARALRERPASCSSRRSLADSQSRVSSSASESAARTQMPLCSRSTRARAAVPSAWPSPIAADRRLLPFPSLSPAPGTQAAPVGGGRPPKFAGGLAGDLEGVLCRGAATTCACACVGRIGTRGLLLSCARSSTAPRRHLASAR